MNIVKTISDVRHHVLLARSVGKTIGLVPTMGALHEGHASLIDAAAGQCDYVVVSIFVNPTQFGPNEDFDQYPRDLDSDARLCQNHDADLIFAPDVGEMYPDKLCTTVTVDSIIDCLCGKFRPGHFAGVTTVCAKLFGIVCPDSVFFGQKDAQQVAVIKKMASDLNMPFQIVSCPTVRDSDGLALSSRNRYLTDSQRQQALHISRALFSCQDLVRSGTRDTSTLLHQINDILTSAPDIEVQYAEIVHPDTLVRLDTVTDRALAAIAVFLGQTRLIDNIIIDLNNL